MGTTESRTTRVAPLPPAERDADQQKLLADAGELAVFTTLIRGGTDLYRAWLRFAGRLLRRSALPARDREILILRTAFRCGSAYEWGHHAEIAVTSGLSADEVALVADAPATAGALGAFEVVLLQAADELVDDHELTQPTWDALAVRYTEPQLVELTLLVGQYVMLAGTLRSLGVQPEHDRLAALPQPTATPPGL